MCRFISYVVHAGSPTGNPIHANGRKTSKFAIDEDEMDSLGENLDFLPEVYDDVETPYPVPAFGHPSLDGVYREFTDAATEKIGGSSDWCEGMSEVVSDTLQMTQETDGKWTKQFMSQVQKFQRGAREALSVAGGPAMRNDEALPNGKTTPDDRHAKASRCRRSETAPHNDDANAKSRR